MKAHIQTTLKLLSSLLAAMAISACGGNNDSGTPAPPPDEIWMAEYNLLRENGSPEQTFRLLDYTRALFFEGLADKEQTARRLSRVMRESPSVRVRESRRGLFIRLAMDLRPEFRGMSSDALVRYVHTRNAR